MAIKVDDLLNNSSSKGAYIGVNGVARKITKGYIGINGVARKIKKVYIGVNGIARLCYEEGSAIGNMAISYTGNMIDSGVVSMTDGEYRLLTLTSSGTLTVGANVSAEVWLCGGGANGNAATYAGGGVGGGGAYTNRATLTLSGSAVATVGAARGVSRFGSYSASPAAGKSGGTGGGGGTYPPDSSNNAERMSPGMGDCGSKYPFGDTSYFKPHCAGGGGGAMHYDGEYGSEYYAGGVGGTNGSDGGYAQWYSDYVSPGGTGGNYGGGKGGEAGYYQHIGAQADHGWPATFYGSGGGGGGYINIDDGGEEDYGYGGNGYQGVIYIRIPVNQVIDPAGPAVGT